MQECRPRASRADGFADTAQIMHAPFFGCLELAEGNRKRVRDTAFSTKGGRRRRAAKEEGIGKWRAKEGGISRGPSFARSLPMPGAARRPSLPADRDTHKTYVPPKCNRGRKERGTSVVKGRYAVRISARPTFGRSETRGARYRF